VTNIWSFFYTTQVCDDVTEIQCDIVPYTECEMGMQSTPYKSCVPVQKNFTEKDCKEMKEVTQHKKMIPECRNVTKQNCVTKWETDANGKQVRQFTSRWKINLPFLKKPKLHFQISDSCYMLYCSIVAIFISILYFEYINTLKKWSSVALKLMTHSALQGWF